MRALVDELEMDIMSRDFVSSICILHVASCYTYVVRLVVVMHCSMHVCLINDLERKDTISLCCCKKWSGVPEANGVRVLGRP